MRTLDYATGKNACKTRASEYMLGKPFGFSKEKAAVPGLAGKSGFITEERNLRLLFIK